MSKSLYSFKFLSEDLIQDLAASFSFERFSDENGREISYCLADSGNNCFRIDDKSGDWNPEEHDINIYGQLYFERGLSFLFDQEQGVVGRNGKIGIACEWFVKQTGIRGAFQIDSTISINRLSDSYEFSFCFPRGIIRGDVLFSFVFFIREKDLSLGKNNFIANEVGTVLGSFLTVDIYFEGNGSLFPVMDFEGVLGDPLWRFIYNSSDPRSDYLIEKNCCLMINTNHPGYAELMKKGARGKNSYLLTDVMSSAIQLLIESALNADATLKNAIEDGEDFDFGTIAYCIKYFSETLRIDVSGTPTRLAESIREYIEG